MSIIEGLRSHYRILGFAGVFHISRARVLKRAYMVKAVALGIAHPIHLRLRTSDLSVFEEIILNAEYDIGDVKDPKVIVDAGANIGLTSVYFANKYADARIIAIEPERSNYEVLLKNVAPYPNIFPVHAALWHENAPVAISDPGSGTWGFQTTSQAVASQTHAQGLTIDSLMKTWKLDHIDILKIDIEGSEREVFQQPGAWIGAVDVIMIELHDRYRSGCSESVFSATRQFGIRTQRGETHFLARPFAERRAVAEVRHG